MSGKLSPKQLTAMVNVIRGSGHDWFVPGMDAVLGHIDALAAEVTQLRAENERLDAPEVEWPWPADRQPSGAVEDPANPWNRGFNEALRQCRAAYRRAVRQTRIAAAVETNTGKELELLKERELLKARLAAAEQHAREQYERIHQEVRNRDAWEERLTKLCYRIAPIEVIGEWSSANELDESAAEVLEEIIAMRDRLAYKSATQQQRLAAAEAVITKARATNAALPECPVQCVPDARIVGGAE